MNLQIREPDKPRSAPPAGALWALGFRPFYLLAGLYACISIPLWVARYSGWITGPYGTSGGSPVLHAHEMLFGYTLAVIAGFLLTAVRNWTGRPTASGGWLAALALLWIAGRVLAFGPWPGVAALVNAAFPAALAVAVAIPLAASANRRNYFFVAVLAGLSVAIVTLHLSSTGVLHLPELISVQAGLDVVLFVIAVLGGRVIPMFTNNGIPGTSAGRNPVIEKLSLGSILALLVCDVLQAPPTVIVLVTIVAALAHAARLWLWQPWRTTHVPLVWILHASYAWIVVHLVLRALDALGVVPQPIAVHALTIGTIGGMTLGMMTRTSRGHSGRPLVAGASETAMYALVQLAALVRVGGGLVAVDSYRASVVASGLCWSVAFALFVVRYWPVLTRPRIDGKAG